MDDDVRVVVVTKGKGPTLETYQVLYRPGTAYQAAGVWRRWAADPRLSLTQADALAAISAMHVPNPPVFDGVKVRIAE